ncbi:putative UDP-glucoronosyl and UDP-glucosyl transferase [Xylariomycetidae sp. FL2044]|nr:putative UDP-glucoronosyl and UDP-glucosyl transferase [Xylariomycetidae sp. FL2044]
MLHSKITVKSDPCSHYDARMDAANRAPSGPPRRILALVTTGGFTHAAPVLEICRVLASRGHTIEFATCAGQERWVDEFPFVRRVHSLAEGPSEADYEAHYRRMLMHDPSRGIGPVMQSKYLWDACWPDVYARLKKLCLDESTRPDFIIADFFIDAAALDMQVEFGVPCAVVYPQMPFLMAPVPYIPGQPGFQVDMTAITSEHASIRARIRNEMVIFWALPHILPWMRWRNAMRRQAGVKHKVPSGSKPNFLVLVNSFFGLEVPKELPPLISAIGPVLADEYPPLPSDYSRFLDGHSSTIYIALGTHVILPEADVMKLFSGLVYALDAGYINGVIWSVSKTPRKEFNRALGLQRANGESITLGDIVDGKHPDFLVPLFAPQRAILDHPSTALYLTHGGGSSAQEALFHGVRVLTLGIYFDQLSNSAKLRMAGVGLSLDKFTFTAEEISVKIGELVRDETGVVAQSVERMKRIARIASRRKYLAADLVEEVMYDAELRFTKSGKEIVPMHLQTPDVRMSSWRARNWDLWAVGMGAMALPLIGGFYGRRLWLDGTIKSVAGSIAQQVFELGKKT